MILYLILKDDFNLILLFINLLPIYPLDGGRALSLYFVNAYKVIGIIFFGFDIFAVFLSDFYRRFIFNTFDRALSY
ncbi:MAG: hypothetical protein LUG95_08485, partial [Clostridiales bacterium]|nr:hypothetical protein [Clostridiales bacterium]